jgi:transketolase
MIICLKKVLESPSPFYIRYTNQAPLVKHSDDFEIGKAEVVSDTGEITILVYGILFNQAYIAKSILENEGKTVRLVNIRTPKPVDEKAILESVNISNLIVTLEDHFLTGGLYSIVAETLLNNKITATVLPIALENKWFKPALFNDVLEYEGFTGEKIAKRILDKLK